MSLFTEEARARAIAQACNGLNNMDHRPLRGLGAPIRTRLEAMRDIRAYEELHGLTARNIQPLKRAYLRAI